MIQLSNTKPLALACFVLSVGILASCKKDNDDTNSGKVELLSFGPTGARIGDTLRFVGNNLDKVTAINLTGDSVAKSAFLTQTSQLILIIVPKLTQQGFVTLKTPDGNVVSKTMLNLLVTVKVTSIPKQARPGDNITISGEYMNWVTGVKFGKEKLVSTFVSKSINQLVVQVPVDAQTGQLYVYTSGTLPLEILTDSTLNVTLPAATGFSPNPATRGQNLTITGTNLDLTKGVWFKGRTAPDTVFVSKSATQLVINIPAAANKGKVTLVAYSGLTVESAQSLLFVGDLPDLAPLRYAFYIDNLQNPWQNWGWSSTADFTNTENVRDGTASIKMDYTGQYGALKFANGSVSTTGYTELTFSVYGTPGTGGKKINLMPSGGSTYTITVDEGKWTEYKLPMSAVGNPATITDLTFQNQDWTGKVYYDHIGLR